MLPTELLMFKVKAGLVVPRRLKPSPSNLGLVTALVGVFESHLNDKRFQLEEDFKALEVGRSDYRVVRGLAHLLANDNAEFETGGSVEPGVVREKVFELKPLVVQVRLEDPDQGGHQPQVAGAGFESPRHDESGLDLEHQQLSREH